MERDKRHGSGKLSAAHVVAVTGCVALYLLFQATVVGLNAMHLLILLFLALYLAHPATRRLAIALLPFILFGITYDWLRLYPNYKVNPIDIRGLHDAEAALFGINIDGHDITLSEYFWTRHTPFADIMAGVFYLCWVPVPMAFALWLYLSGKKRMYLHFSLAFLLCNWLGFIGYYIHPAAPPWYVINHGYEAVLSTPGNMAGLAHFDRLTGLSVFKALYESNSNVFAAVPSLHASYMLITTCYAVRSRQPWLLTIVFAIITLGIWWTAVYTAHHYVIDVLLGIATAIIAVFLFEWGVKHISCFRKFIHRYTQLI